MTHVEFFAGIGGFSLGLEGISECVAFSEIDPYACKVFERHWPGIRNLGDIHEIAPADIPASDMWCGGFPCQPFSVAGKRSGKNDERDLWPIWARLISKARPRYLLAENVPGLLSIDGGRLFGRCIRDLAKAGYVCEWAVIGADDIVDHTGTPAPHRRKRLWIWAELADSNGEPVQERGNDSPDAEASGPWCGNKGGSGGDDSREFEPAPHDLTWPPGWSIDPADVAHPDDTGLSERRRAEPVQTQHVAPERGCLTWSHGWSIDPADVADPEERTERPGLREDEPAGERGRRHGNGSCPCCGAEQGAVASMLGGMVDELSAWLDRAGGRLDGTTGDSRNTETLRLLRDGDAAQAIQRGLGEQSGVQAAAILFAYLREQSVDGGLRRTIEQGAEALEGSVREMRERLLPGGASYRRGQREQLSSEYLDPVRDLPLDLPSPFPVVGRVASRIPDRVDRLRCLGNAVVPQVVRWIAERMGER